MPTVHTLDLNFQGRPQTIAAYLVPHATGGILVEAGPGSTIPALQHALHAHGLTAADISDVFLTHIHLDHAGAAGWLAQQGARIHVHANGAPHLLNPEKLIASATRIYGERMDTLWGQFYTVPPEKLSILQDGQVVEAGGLQVRAIDTLGHARHHLVYMVDGICFSGDTGGIRLPGNRHVSLPMPPPEFHVEEWRQTLARLRQEKMTHIVPTHYGVYDDPDWHLAALSEALDEVEAWMEAVMPSEPSTEELRQRFAAFEQQRLERSGIRAEGSRSHALANPTDMSADGIARYWRKYRAAPQG